MKKSVLISCLLVIALSTTAYAVPIHTAEKGTVPMRERAPEQEGCTISYYNFCSGWVFYWSGYCYGEWMTLSYPPQYGTVFDLSDCPGSCRHLMDCWWACKRFTVRAWVELEIFCANEYGCPIGPPLWGPYGFTPNISNPWQHFALGGLPLCGCEETGPGKFVIVITDQGYGAHTSPYSDIESYNINAGCQPDWDCTGHSYSYRCAVSYCDVYGAPGPMWVSGPYGCDNVPFIPPGCHDYYGYGAGMFTEFLFDVYIACQGPTATETDSWSEIKSLYR